MKPRVFGVVFIAVATLCVIHVSSSTAVPSLQSSKSPHWRFDNRRNRNIRFEQLYENITEMKEIELDKRMAAAVRFDPFIIVQFFLSTYVLLNHLIEPVLPDNFRPRSRLQNLLMETSVHILEIFLRIQIPQELSNQSGIFCDQDILQDAREDMIRLASTREGQQIAYSLICIFNGHPAGCVAPLLIRNIPAFLRYLGIIILLCFPSYGNNGTLINLFGNLFSSSRGSDRSESKSSSDCESLLGSDKNIQEPSSTLQSVEFDISMSNSGVVTGLVSETLSLIFETFILIKFIINVPEGKDGKINPLIIFKHLFCAILTFQYVAVRGRTFGAFFSSTFHGTRILDNVQNTLKMYVLLVSNFSLENILNSFKSSSVEEPVMKKSKTTKRGKKGGKTAKKVNKIEEKAALDI